MPIKKISYGILFFGVATMIGCGDKTTHWAQSTISANAPMKEMVATIRNDVKKFSEENGFNNSPTGDETTKALEKSGRFSWLFIKEVDESFVMVQNILKPKCINVAIYSADGEEAAKALTAEIADRLKEELGDGIEIFPGPDCKVPQSKGS